MSEIERRVAVVGPTGSRSTGELTLQLFTPSERLLRALRAFSTWFVVAILSVFIPLAHFVLVPLFLIVSVAAGSLAHSRKQIVLGGQARCPDCGVSFNLASGAHNLPFLDICTGCSRPVRVEWTAGSDKEIR